MNRSLIKFITDFGPLLIFFIFYYQNDKDLKVAILPFIIATLISLAVIYFLEKRIPMVPLIGGILVTFFGGLTLYFDNKIFFYHKPTIINLLFAGDLFFQNTLNLEDEGWKKLNYRWIYFFIFLALLNITVVETQTEEFWVNFKVWGLLPITFIFTAFQIPLINKYKIEEQ